jgi:cobalt transporter subunit CbtB
MIESTESAQSTSNAGSGAEIAGRLAAALPAILAVLLGLFVLWGVGFAGADLLHNVAHDTRHGLAFPCH